ncbi:MAG: 50S ribosomal protein L24e [Methanosarcina thermophila]|jgi:large subunit ribosomal protein L24e|uniref:Large ribosomal subunit protein eL24 n=3 Tax=Methanosarcina thermophila TaxID=2210 RepID=A0A0E3NHD0_METTE|nr:50S ribosomal protein L24e [Methanosarcina thermophila]ALK05848.1 MAG: 50S ribosomal protein L24 [Methanosarcina sp. 795]AKB16714.1 LSU ribosomal protein L24e [Methanosarcina thermophila CHTI-55]NLU57667.1 50S ribosomal protein L24e [Methanosarcina thermophila]BAW30356.1 LSU ribosomal protein L24E [Methanosarcina thermophila]GLI13279.1 50S ribosomal protein L24e [Methanosarcina thermophila MST-A1]
MEQRKCYFCGKMLEPGTGKLYVKKDGSTYYMHSSKCMNNFNLGRLPRRTEWTEKGRIQLKKA